MVFEQDRRQDGHCMHMCGNTRSVRCSLLPEGLEKRLIHLCTRVTGTFSHLQANRYFLLRMIKCTSLLYKPGES